MAESFVDTFKTELVADRVWRTRNQFELETVEWIGWYNHRRLHESLGDIPPVEYEALHTGGIGTFSEDETVRALSASVSQGLTQRPLELVGAEIAGERPLDSVIVTVNRTLLAQAAPKVVQ
jgi:putative transposase